jgi:crotonobetainyl-CoA:carnitine CoA-transferase CaiB-like acyl-CoA transferase
MTLDMRNPGANDLLKKLIKSVDVVLENARPGSMEQRGFGYAQAREANPKIIWCGLTGFGQTGPNADHSGHDVSYLAHSGLLSAIEGDVSNAMPGIMLAGPFASMSAVIGIQAALLQRAKSGEGSFVDTSISEAAGWALTGGIFPLSEKALIVTPAADRRIYECADGRYVAVASAEPRTWAALCDGLELPELKDNLHKPALDTAITEALRKAFKTGSAADWVAKLAPTGAAVTIVNHAAQILEDPHIRARGSVADVAGTPIPATPIRVSAGGRQTATNTTPPPKVGQHTEAVLEAAGFSRAEIEGFASAKLI